MSGIRLRLECNTAASEHTIFAKSMRHARRQSRKLVRAFKEANPNPTAFCILFTRPERRGPPL